MAVRAVQLLAAVWPTDSGADAAKPLTGVVLCCTSIAPEERRALAAAATLLGATHKLDLTADVTHLLVGHWDTAKYRYVAKERPDVWCLRPSFVTAAHAAWLEGADALDLTTLEETHRWPTLGGVKVCVTGFQDLEFRREVEARVTEEGGEYHGDLTRDITHLVVHQPRGDKYTHAKQWGIKCVAVEWLRETLQRGMVLEDRYYDPALHPDELGVGAWVKEMNRAHVGEKRKSDSVAENKPARKLRRTASAKFSSQNENIWGDIVGGDGFAAQKQTKRDAWAENAAEDGGEGTRPASRNNGQLELRLESRPQSRADARPDSRADSHSHSALSSGPQLTRSALLLQPNSRVRLEGKAFYLHGFDKKQVKKACLPYDVC